MSNHTDTQPESTPTPAEVIEEAREWDAYYAEQDADYWSPVEQGFYDDDPSPYNGDYSEM
jgi:hypothetical protein